MILRLRTAAIIGCAVSDHIFREVLIAVFLNTNRSCSLNHDYYSSNLLICFQPPTEGCNKAPDITNAAPPFHSHAPRATSQEGTRFLILPKLRFLLRTRHRWPLVLRFIKGAIHRAIVIPVILHGLFAALVVYLDSYHEGNLGLPASIVCLQSHSRRSHELIANSNRP